MEFFRNSHDNPSSNIMSARGFDFISKGSLSLLENPGDMDSIVYAGEYPDNHIGQGWQPRTSFHEIITYSKAPSVAGSEEEMAVPAKNSQLEEIASQHSNCINIEVGTVTQVIVATDNTSPRSDQAIDSNSSPSGSRSETFSHGSIGSSSSDNLQREVFDTGMPLINDNTIEDTGFRNMEENKSIDMCSDGFRMPLPPAVRDERRSRCDGETPRARKARQPRQPKQPKQPVKKVSRREITKCPHVDRPFYAKGMCKNCYHAGGREKLTSACPHVDRPKYAHGVCKNCYLSKYHRERRLQRKLAAQEKKKDGNDANAGKIASTHITKSRSRKTAVISVTTKPALLMTVAENCETEQQMSLKTFEAAVMAAAVGGDCNSMAEIESTANKITAAVQHLGQFTNSQAMNFEQISSQKERVDDTLNHFSDPEV